MPFKLNRIRAAVPDTPEALLHDLRPRKIEGLLSHQADLLRAYVAPPVLEHTDVALQLPTGSGKTLVGLLIAEWRRRKFGQRVLYLCPTKQLVHQVVAEGYEKYGIRPTAFTGRHIEYPPAAKASYQTGETVAVAPYSALFNVRPFFKDPEIIILDDAHAAENYVVAYWSLRISLREEDHAPAFEALSTVLRASLSAAEMKRLRRPSDDPWDRSWTEKIPTPVFAALHDEIVGILDETTRDTDLRYTWSVLRDHLHACHMYLGAREILIRPLVPPTSTHAPFANAKQRLYMSATLGEGGDLERLTGRTQIVRLPVPPGWDKQGTGRRLFFFPEASLSGDDTRSAVSQMIERAGRALYLVRDDATATDVRDWIEADLGYELFTARQIEESKKNFVQTEQAVAVVANRYDGIDLGGDACRLLIVDGLPRAANLQERFLMQRMGAMVLLEDRIRTRVVQAFGRCTRSNTDYAAVVVLGEELQKYLMTREKRDALHPELQAELAFGIEESKNVSVETFAENLAVLLVQDEEWAEAEKQIVNERAATQQAELAGITDLAAAVQHEVRFQYAMWEGNYTAALDYAREVLAALAHPALRGYRALWLYLAGSAAWHAAQRGTDALLPVAREYFGKAAGASSSARWLLDLAQRVELKPEDGAAAGDSTAMAVVERLESMLDHLGMVHNRSFDAEVAAILKGLATTEANSFEDAQTRLGRLLGYEAGNEESEGAPDPWWIADETVCIVFEDHSDAQPTSKLSVKKARQAASHPRWIRANKDVDVDADVLAVLVTPVSKADPPALIHLAEVAYWPLDAFREWAVSALTVVRELRRAYHEAGDFAWRADALDQYERNNMSPAALLRMLRKSLADERLA